MQPSAPIEDPVLLLNGDGIGLINNLCFPSRWGSDLATRLLTTVFTRRSVKVGERCIHGVFGTRVVHASQTDRPTCLSRVLEAPLSKVVATTTLYNRQFAFFSRGILGCFACFLKLL